jgi:peroxiredoxin
MPAGLRSLAAVMVVLLASWAGTRAYLNLHPGRTEVTTRVGEASAPNPSDLAAPEGGAYSGPEVPEALPAFSLDDLDGKPTAISTWNGHSLVINFWATWCAPCQREIPLLKTLATEWLAQDFTVVGIAVDHREKVRQFAERFKIPYPLLVGEQEGLDVAGRFGMADPVFPFTVFTDARGEVVTLFVGELHKPQVDLILATVQNLNRGRVQLPQARQSIADGLSALAAKRS